MKGILICPNEKVRLQFEQATAESYPALLIVKSFDDYASEEALRRVIRVWAPEIVFTSMEDFPLAELTSRLIETEFPSLQRIGLSSQESPSVFRKVIHLRMSELLVAPFEPEALERALDRVATYMATNPANIGQTGKLFAFMPAKGGVGASTIAAAVSRALAETQGFNILLADFDAYAGTTGFLFNTQHDYGLSDAAELDNALDQESWQRLTKRAENMDLLMAGSSKPGRGIRVDQIASVLDFARRCYSIVNADLPDSLDDTSLKVLGDADRIFIVTTPDLAALRIARLKANWIRDLEWQDKTFLILNRVSKRMEMSTKEVEEAVGLAVFGTFPCEYSDVSRAAREARPAAKLTESAKQFIEKLLNQKMPVKKARFIERFTLLPTRHMYSVSR